MKKLNLLKMIGGCYFLDKQIFANLNSRTKDVLFLILETKEPFVYQGDNKARHLYAMGLVVTKVIDDLMLKRMFDHFSAILEKGIILDGGVQRLIDL